MAMTKKDYQIVAKALANQRENIEHRQTIELNIVDEVIETIAAHFALINDRFDVEIFKEAADYGKDSNA